MKHKKTLQRLCQECKNKCCTNWNVEYKETNLPVLTINKYPVGSKINYEGIIMERNKYGLWDCVFFNKKTGKCNIYDIRPLICRYWHCEQHCFPKDWHDDNKIVIHKNKIV